MQRLFSSHPLMKVFTFVSLFSPEPSPPSFLLLLGPPSLLPGFPPRRCCRYGLCSLLATDALPDQHIPSPSVFGWVFHKTKLIDDALHVLGRAVDDRGDNGDCGREGGGRKSRSRKARERERRRTDVWARMLVCEMTCAFLWDYTHHNR